jgi:hypothetical protein
MQDIVFTENEDDYNVLALTLHIAINAAKTDTSFGYLVRNLEGIDTGIFKAILQALAAEPDKRQFQFDENSLLHLVAACDIARKSFLCDAIDEVEHLSCLSIGEGARTKVIRYCNARIKQFSESELSKNEVLPLLARLDEIL